MVGSSSGSSGGSSRRVTFLVNVWLNHAPKTASPLADEVASSLTCGQELAAKLSADDFDSPTVVRVRQAEGVGGSPPTPGMGGAEGGGAGSRTRGAIIARGADNDVGDESEEGGKRTDHRGDDDEECNQCSSEEVCRRGCATCPAPPHRPAAPPAAGAAGACSFAETTPAGSMSIATVSSCGGLSPAGARGGDSGVATEGGDDGAVDMRWEFGEVGDEAEEQVHLRHEVLVPVPAGLLFPSRGGRGKGGESSSAVVGEGGGGGGGGSFCVEYCGSRKPQVTRVGGRRDSSDGESSGSEEEGGEEQEQEEEGEEAERVARGGRNLST